MLRMLAPSVTCEVGVRLNRMSRTAVIASSCEVVCAFSRFAFGRRGLREGGGEGGQHLGGRGPGFSRCRGGDRHPEPGWIHFRSLSYILGRSFLSVNP